MDLQVSDTIKGICLNERVLGSLAFCFLDALVQVVAIPFMDLQVSWHCSTLLLGGCPESPKHLNQRIGLRVCRDLGYDQRYMPERKGFGLSGVLLFRRPGISSRYTLHGPASLLALQYVATRWLPREPKTPKSKNRP